MTSRLYRLAYCSRSRLDGPAAAISEDIQEILHCSRRNNLAAGITGALMFNAGVFAQVLEGDRARVEAIFERIQGDLRHAESTVMEFEPVESRGFPDWSMGFVGRSAASAALLGGIRTGASLDRQSLKGERIFQLLQTLMLEDEDQPGPGRGTVVPPLWNRA
jgi:hypothetical protein